MTTIVAFVVVIGILILIHELGHFVVARWMGVGVDRFSIGFGPVLLRWKGKGKETEYCLSAIPMGGYVKMMGEESPLEGGGSGMVDPAKSFSLKPLWARFLIVFAGPGMNFVLAAVIFAAVFMILGRPVLPSTLGRIRDGGPAAQAGLRTGDRITAVDGIRVAYWEDLINAIQAEGGETRHITFAREGREERTALTPARTMVRDIFGDEREIWDIGARPFAPAKIGEVSPGYPAGKAGLRAGDTVVALDGVPVLSWDELAEAIHKRAGKRTELIVERDGKSLTVTVVPQPFKDRGPSGEEVEIGRIGISPAVAVSYVRSNPIVAVGQGVLRTWDMTVLTAVGLWKLVTRQLPASTIGGPIQIAVVAGEQAKQGFTSLAFFTAVISVNLALLNLLPVPMLDGGHLFFFVIEGIRGRPLSLKKREVAQQVGLFLLLLLMVFAVYNDLSRIDFFRFFK
ncbi:MAG: RIP metalloprotease RseP [Candidatus Rokubacteria bacterium]|nr:RIP metalloprotease RseP [Candidatus Rokubacteria bacterium]